MTYQEPLHTKVTAKDKKPGGNPIPTIITFHVALDVRSCVARMIVLLAAGSISRTAHRWQNK